VAAGREPFERYPTLYRKSIFQYHLIDFGASIDVARRKTSAEPHCHQGEIRHVFEIQIDLRRGTTALTFGSVIIIGWNHQLVSGGMMPVMEACRRDTRFI
jgi:hypothetical protein